MRGQPKTRERVKQRALGHDAADGAAPVGEQQAAFEMRARHQIFHRAGQVTDVTQAGRKRRGQRRSAPAGDEDFRVNGRKFLDTL